MLLRALKTADPLGSQGSNPCLSAIYNNGLGSICEKIKSDIFHFLDNFGTLSYFQLGIWEEVKAAFTERGNGQRQAYYV